MILAAITLAGAISAVAGEPVAPDPKGVQNSDSVQSAMTEELHDWRNLTTRMVSVRDAKVDEFTPRPTQADLIGQSFKIVLPIGSRSVKDNPFDSSGGWTYDPDKQILSVHVSIARYSAFELHDSAERALTVLPGFYLGHRIVSTNEREAQNGFGAQFEVTEIVEDTHVLAFAPGLRHRVTDADLDLSVDLTFSPEMARAAVPNLAIELSGSFLPLEGPRVILCGDHVSTATISSPYEHLDHVCAAGADIESVRAVILKPDGNVELAHWNLRLSR
jgi:hypothetical protein